MLCIFIRVFLDKKMRKRTKKTDFYKIFCPSGGGGGAGRRRLEARRAERERRPGRGAGAIPRRGRVEVRTRRGMMLKQYDTFKPLRPWGRGTPAAV